MSKRLSHRRARATILHGAGRPVEHVLVEQLVARLRGETYWQSVFTDAEREVWLDAAARYFRLQRKAGFALDEAYEMVLVMLTHAHIYVNALEAKRAETASVDAPDGQRTASVDARFALRHWDDWQ